MRDAKPYWMKLAERNLRRLERAAERQKRPAEQAWRERQVQILRDLSVHRRFWHNRPP